VDTVRVFLVGGTPLLRCGIETALNYDARVACVGHVPDVATFGASDRAACDVVIVNTERPRADAAAIQALSGSGAGPKVLVLTENERLDEQVATLQLGVQGYGLRHDLQAEELRAAVLAVAERDSWMCPRATRNLMVSTAQQPADWLRASAHGRLSGREREVLQLAARGDSEQKIADTLCLTKNTVKTYLQRICEKLGARSRKDAYRRAYELRLVADRRGRPGGADRAETREAQTNTPVERVA
jgi:DNA-binding NarL/FixJ family response regulator